MTKQKNTKKALLASVLSVMLCVAMLVGSTFAWFTDSVTSGKNRIVAGNLDVELEYKNASTQDAWKNASEASVANPNFFVDKNGNDILWEPGVMSVTQFKVVNKGSLALEYSLETLKAAFNTMAGHDLSEVIKFAVVDNDEFADLETRDDVIAMDYYFDDFTSFSYSGSTLLPEDKAENGEFEEIFTVVAYWEPTAEDNLYNVNNGQKTDDNADRLYIDIEIQLTAKQLPFEEDSFGADYDEGALYEGEVTPDMVVDAFNNGGTLTLSEDMDVSRELSSMVTPASDLVLDLNGHTLKLGGTIDTPNGVSITIKNGTLDMSVLGNTDLMLKGDVTIDNATIKVYYFEHLPAFMNPDGTGTMVITNSTIEVLDKNVPITFGKGSDTTISGSTFTGKIKVDAGATLNIVDGTFNQTGLTADQFAQYVSEGSTLTDNGDGNFTVALTIDEGNAEDPFA